ncbi:Tn3 family transposase [Clostridium sp. CS001]|uniref:Tn3 family transposase n=1 Tax=Clostridium sp. CS001 TaxID=2880648 RepID=UPI0039A5CB0D
MTFQLYLRFIKFWEHEFQAQFQKSSCLNIILNAIVIWNTKYLTKSWNHYVKENSETDETLLKHISPLNWEHINFLGEYSFDVNVQFETDNLRKLNL